MTRARNKSLINQMAKCSQIPLHPPFEKAEGITPSNPSKLSFLLKRSVKGFMCEKIIIKNERMSGWLQFNGFHKLYEQNDNQEANKLIYIFKDTQQIRNCMSKYNQFKQLLNE